MCSQDLDLCALEIHLLLTKIYGRVFNSAFWPPHLLIHAHLHSASVKAAAVYQAGHSSHSSDQSKVVLL